MKDRLLACFLVAAFVSGCGHQVGLRGVATGTRTCNADKGTPVPAEVALRCGDALAGRGTADREGRFFLELDDVTADCEVTVSAPGYHPRRYRIGDLCPRALDRPEDTCDAASLYAVLTPQKQASSEPEAP